MDAPNYIHVVSEHDGRRYKLVMKSSLHGLTAAKIKTNLQRVTGVPVEQQTLRFQDTIFDEVNSMTPIHGIHCGAVMTVAFLTLSSSSHEESSVTGRSGELSDDPSPQPISRQLFMPQGTSSRSASHENHSSHPPLLSASFPSRSKSSCESHGLSGERISSSPDPALLLQEENAELRRRVSELESMCLKLHHESKGADWKLEEEIVKLRGDVRAAHDDRERLTMELNAIWQAKENDLIRELDLCREERRTIHHEREQFESQLTTRIHELQGALRLKSEEVRDKEEMLLASRQQLAALQSQLNPQEDDDGCHANMTASRSFRRSQYVSFDQIVEDALAAIAHSLHLKGPIVLSDDNTAVIRIPNLAKLNEEEDDLNILITLDPEAELLFLYATPLNYLPSHPAELHRLYEMLLKAALLGKNVAGGSVGISQEDELVILSKTFELRHSDVASIFTESAPTFVSTAREWTYALHRSFPQRLMR